MHCNHPAHGSATHPVRDLLSKLCLWVSQLTLQALRHHDWGSGQRDGAAGALLNPHTRLAAPRGAQPAGSPQIKSQQIRGGTNTTHSQQRTPQKQSQPPPNPLTVPSSRAPQFDHFSYGPTHTESRNQHGHNPLRAEAPGNSCSEPGSLLNTNPPSQRANANH